jgi:hypothetical protein
MSEQSQTTDTATRFQIREVSTSASVSEASCTTQAGAACSPDTIARGEGASCDAPSTFIPGEGASCDT